MANLIEDYKKTAEQHEKLFRSVLRDVQQRSPICPKDLNPDESVNTSSLELTSQLFA